MPRPDQPSHDSADAAGSLEAAASPEAATRAAIASVWRCEAAKVTAALARIVGDLGTAEELAQDALLAALEEWPLSGVPDKPAAWLMTAAKHRALNALKRARMMERKHEELGHQLEASAAALPAAMEEAFDAAMIRPLNDDVLRLLFTACHPVVPREARVALTLRVVGGLSTLEIARAFLAQEQAIGQRIVRAKRALAEAAVGFEVPSGAALGARLASVLEVVYLIFNEGYAASAGDDLMRPALCDEAIRLGRLLAELAPEEPEVHGLSALMQLHASRTPARVDAEGEPVLLLEQDRGRWDRALMNGGLAALVLAEALQLPPRSYQLQAAIAACHARAAHPDATDWARIAALYGELGALAPSPIIELNRAVAISRAEGPAAALPLLDALEREQMLASYHFLPSARADVLERLGRHEEASQAFARAAALAENARQRARLELRAAECGRRAASGTT